MHMKMDDSSLVPHVQRRWRNRARGVSKLIATPQLVVPINLPLPVPIFSPAAALLLVAILISAILDPV